MKRTKIICTLGPASTDEDVLRQLIRGGMDIARFNFSHGSYEEHAARFAQLDKLRSELRAPVRAKRSV